MGTTAVISAYSYRINDYNLVLVTSWCILQQTNVSTPDLSPLQCRYKYYKGLTSQIRSDLRTRSSYKSQSENHEFKTV